MVIEKCSFILEANCLAVGFGVFCWFFGFFCLFVLFFGGFFKENVNYVNFLLNFLLGIGCAKHKGTDQSISGVSE